MNKKIVGLVIGILFIVLGIWVLSTRVQAVPALSRSYVVSLDTPGGEIPFALSAVRSDPLGDWTAVILTGFVTREYSEPIDVVMTGEPTDFEVSFPHYDSILRLKAGDDPDVLTGTWQKTRGEESITIMNASALVAGKSQAFRTPGSGSDRMKFDGKWRVQFGEDETHAIGDFTVDIDGNASGTFLTTTGDYRYLAGRVNDDLMTLSTFDGAHAFLFHARMQEDGSITGDFWSGNWHHETWTAVRDDNATLPDAFEQTTITDEQALADAVFKDIDGNPTRVLDALDETNAKARVLEIFGTWCPNCSDAGRELVSLKEQYGDDLGIVGLAFEVTEDFARSSQQVQRHHAHIGSDWEILIAGLSDKAKATETLGFLDRVRSYPTLIFLNADNEVQAVYSGFSGPATGDAYTQQRQRFEALIEGMINE
jgi:thiol-disulfide isomerase/thioredoxin